MAKAERDKVMVAEQVFELRHGASGTFLDIRGFIADYVREAGFLPHWKIDSNVVSFRDSADKVEKEGAFVGYRSLGYFAFDPGTGNFFVDRASKFWKLISQNKQYPIPGLARFGARTKVFLPTAGDFETLNRQMYGVLFSQAARQVLAGTETDLQFVVELRDGAFDVRITGGPIHPKEAAQHFRFGSPEFDKPGLFLDVDFYQNRAVQPDEVTKMLHTAQDKTWRQVEALAAALGV